MEITSILIFFSTMCTNLPLNVLIVLISYWNSGELCVRVNVTKKIIFRLTIQGEVNEIFFSFCKIQIIQTDANFTI